MNLVLSHQKSFAPHTFLPLCFLINILAIAVSIPANTRSLVANNSYQVKPLLPAANLPPTRKLLAQAAAVKITDVKVRTAEKGIEIRLESPTTTIPQPVSQNSNATVVSTAGDEIEIIVKGKRKAGYFVPNASSATGTNTPILETPFSVQIIPPELIRDRQATQVKETLANVSGVIFNGDGQSRGGEQLIIRGFEGGAVLRDGFRRGDIGGVTPPTTDIATAERIEVLKGPASILSGAIEPGGLVNLVTKKPLKDP